MFPFSNMLTMLRERQRHRVAVPTSISPSSGDDTGNALVTISGRNFLGATGATAGGVALTSFSVDSDGTITGRTGAHAAGANLDVVVTKAGNLSGTISAAFTYLATTTPPSVAAIGTSAAFAATDTFTVDFPAGVQDGDWAFLVIGCTNAGGDGTWDNDDAGFALAGSQRESTLALSVAELSALASQASSTVTVGLAAAATGNAVIVVYRGDDGLGLQSIAKDSGSGTATVPTNSTSSVAQCLGVLFTAMEVGTGSTPGAGWTEDVDAGAVVRLCVDHKVQAAAGAITGGARSLATANWATIKGHLQSA